jgi:hypothetical protein
MKVRVFALRLRGRRSPKTEDPEGVAGYLQMHSMLRGTELHTVARLCSRTGRSIHDEELLPPLYSPELVALGNGALLLRGFQSIDGAAYVQEWRCVVD